MSRSAWKIAVFPESRWNGWLLAAFVLIMEPLFVVAFLSRETLGERIFWAAFALAFPPAMVLIRMNRYAGVVARARELASAEGSEAVSVGFARAASYVNGSPAPAKPWVDVYSRGALVATETEIQMWAGPEAKKPSVVRPLSDLVTAEVEKKFPGLGFAPILSLTFADGLVIELVVLQGMWTDMFGPTTPHLGRVVEALRAKSSPPGPVS
ncbi:hypothetical protein [Mycetocola zhujimingii]|uniref:hypothetical protein n=1 Tax=Mycetocola zhujimingii TaxID=2079792 RepID=UPI000D3D7984|nr:hypothetical protein [Mycetocola zhujimingii]AWB85507.1 hypothetical protein C3E77_01915 [Mycetocola zhujimingii]